MTMEDMKMIAIMIGMINFDNYLGEKQTQTCGGRVSGPEAMGRGTGFGRISEALT